MEWMLEDAEEWTLEWAWRRDEIVIAEFRVNLTLEYEYEFDEEHPPIDDCLSAGAMVDEVGGVFYVPPGVDLNPMVEWLPFDLDRFQREDTSVLVEWNRSSVGPYLCRLITGRSSGGQLRQP